MSAKARRRARRRDRRKARQSGWKRAGKPMGARVGHGSSAPVRLELGAEAPRKKLKGKAKRQAERAEWLAGVIETKPPPLRVSLGELAGWV